MKNSSLLTILKSPAYKAMNTTILRSAMFFILISYSAFGQMEKGTKLLGGNFHLSMDNSFSDKAYIISTSPNLGIFLTNNFALGGAMDFSYFKLNEWSRVSIGIAPFFRYYFELSKNKDQEKLPAGGKTWLFLHAQPGISLSQSIDDPEEKHPIYSFGYTMGVGLTYLITDNIGLEGILSYNIEEVNIGLSGLAFNVGFQIYLPKGKKE